MLWQMGLISGTRILRRRARRCASSHAACGTGWGRLEPTRHPSRGEHQRQGQHAAIKEVQELIEKPVMPFLNPDTAEHIAMFVEGWVRAREAAQRGEQVVFITRRATMRSHIAEGYIVAQGPDLWASFCGWKLGILPHRAVSRSTRLSRNDGALCVKCRRMAMRLRVLQDSGIEVAGPAGGADEVSSASSSSSDDPRSEPELEDVWDEGEWT